MSREKPKLEAVPTPPDLDEIASKYVDPLHDIDIFSQGLFSVRVGKPKSKVIKFYRAHPDKTYHQRRLLLVANEEEDLSSDEFYLVGKDLEAELRPFTKPFILHTMMDRDLSPWLWPVRMAEPEEEEHKAWLSARAAIARAVRTWVRIYWNKNKYCTIDAKPGYAPEPELVRVKAFEELVEAGFGEANTINNRDHPKYKEWFHGRG